jgi:hypothetical protein
MKENSFGHKRENLNKNNKKGKFYKSTLKYFNFQVKIK